MRASTAAHLRTLDSSTEDDDEISEALRCVRALVQVLSDAARTVENKTGVTNAQLFLLQQIRDGREVTVNELAALAMTSQSTVSIVLSRLERKGLVKRARSPSDGRRVILGLTGAGKQLLRRAPRPATGEVIGALRRLKPEEIRAVCRGLGALGRELGFDFGAPTMLFERRRAADERQRPVRGRPRPRKR
jgi:DNA-binding MarR family transcriptional regulator